MKYLTLLLILLSSCSFGVRPEYPWTTGGDYLTKAEFIQAMQARDQMIQNGMQKLADTLRAERSEKPPTK